MLQWRRVQSIADELHVRMPWRELYGPSLRDKDEEGSHSSGSVQIVRRRGPRVSGYCRGVHCRHGYPEVRPRYRSGTKGRRSSSTTPSDVPTKQASFVGARTLPVHQWTGRRELTRTIELDG